MKVILTHEVTGLGTAGDVVDVKDGYARNFLLRRGLATAWTKGGQKQVDAIKSARAARAVRDADHAANRAESAARTTELRYSPVTVANRIQKLEAEQRADQRHQRAHQRRREIADRLVAEVQPAAEQRVGQRGEELLAPEAHHQIVLAHMVHQHLCHQLQHLVAHAMAQAGACATGPARRRRGG